MPQGNSIYFLKANQDEKLSIVALSSEHVKCMNKNEQTRRRRSIISIEGSGDFIRFFESAHLKIYILLRY
jgi:hypothetical protein